MTKAVNELLEGIKALPPEQRSELFDAIADAVLEDHSMLSPEYKAELERRSRFIDEHPEKLIPQAEADRRIRAVLGLSEE
jgi:putative addiction module component (TIGR02574 family)